MGAYPEEVLGGSKHFDGTVIKTSFGGCGSLLDTSPRHASEAGFADDSGCA